MLPISLNNRLKKTYGWYCIEKHKNGKISRKIEVNKKYFMVADENDIMNTIIHELIHHIDSISNPNEPYLGHGETFMGISRNVNNKLGYDIDKFANKSFYKEMKELNDIKFYHNFICPSCKYRKMVTSKFERKEDLKKQVCPCGKEMKYFYAGQKYFFRDGSKRVRLNSKSTLFTDIKYEYYDK